MNYAEIIDELYLGLVGTLEPVDPVKQTVGVVQLANVSGISLTEIGALELMENSQVQIQFTEGQAVPINLVPVRFYAWNPELPPDNGEGE